MADDVSDQQKLIPCKHNNSIKINRKKDDKSRECKGRKKQEKQQETRKVNTNKDIDDL